jgi:hypothetical protein
LTVQVHSPDRFTGAVHIKCKRIFTMNVQDILTQLIVIAELAFVLVFVFGLLDVATRDRSTQAAAPVTQAAVSTTTTTDSVVTTPIVNVDSANPVELEFAATPTIADPWASEVTVVQPSFMPQLTIVRSNVLCLPAAQPLLCLPSARPAVSAPQPPKSQSKAKGKAPSQTEQLRCQCTEHGIKWRNANGTNKHLTVKQMQQALEVKAIAA